VAYAARGVYASVCVLVYVLKLSAGVCVCDVGCVCFCMSVCCVCAVWCVFVVFVVFVRVVFVVFVDVLLFL
jgi:hypothetical protein